MIHKVTDILIGLVVISAISSCRQDRFDYESTGTLSFSDFSLNTSYNINLKSDVAEEDYTVLIYSEADGELAYKNTYKEVKKLTSGITLKSGKYLMEVRSREIIPDAEFDSAVYGVSEEFIIEVGKTSKIGNLTCTLLQSAVSIKYNDDFLKSITGNGVTTVEVKTGAPLDYAISYSENSDVKIENRIGYFALDKDEISTMTITFKGSIDGKIQKMTTIISGVKAREHHVITLMKKVSTSGNASFGILIDGLIADAILDNDIKVTENGNGYDPQAPIGDGGIELISTCDYNITEPIVVPSEGSFNLTMQAIIPNGTRKFTVTIASTNEDFIFSVNTVGGTTLDLINPSDAAMGIFTIVPFPHGSELSGATSIDFDLSGAQTPLLAFTGTHTFTMNVTDNKGLKKSIDIVLVVE